MHIWILNNVNRRLLYRRKIPATEKHTLAEMGSFKGKSEILRTITEAAIVQKARKAFGFPASI